jgi:hypothetical protein
MPTVSRVRVHHDVQISVVVKVGIRHTSAVTDVVGTDSHRHIRKAWTSICTEPFVAKQYLMFIAIPAPLAAK